MGIQTRIVNIILLIILVLLPAIPQMAQAADVPRFISIRSTEANMRTGPGTRYPTRYVYHWKNMPVEVIDEHEHWRQIRDIHGETGWIHKTLLSGKRTVMPHTEQRTLRSNPSTNADAIAYMAPLVIGVVERCTKQWCELQVGSHQGWIRKRDIWGVYPDEIIDD